MRPLRYAYVLALAVWLGGLAVAGLVVAPATFGVLQAWDPEAGRVLAGQVFGDVLARMHVVAIGMAVVMLASLTIQRILGPRPPAYGVRAGLIGLMLGATVYSAYVVAPGVEALQQQVGTSMSRLAPDDARRVAFDRLHGRSTTLVTLTLLGGLVLLVWEARE